MAAIRLTPDQEQEAQRISTLLQEKFKDDIVNIARLLASKNDAEIFGETEFEVRDRVHRMGAKAFETVLTERKKGGTKVRV